MPTSAGSFEENSVIPAKAETSLRFRLISAPKMLRGRWRPEELSETLHDKSVYDKRAIREEAKDDSTPLLKNELDELDFRLIEVFSNLPRHKKDAVLSFARAVNVDRVEFSEPDPLVYLSNQPEFRAFVANNQWKDRKSKGWAAHTDVFEFISTTYASYVGVGLGRSSWGGGLDPDLQARIRQKLSDNRKKHINLPSGMPDYLDLPNREYPCVTDGDTWCMHTALLLHDAVARERQRVYQPGSQ